MYKKSSQAQQHSHGVDRPHPSRGFIDAGPDPLDTLPDVSLMTLEQAKTEREQLKRELAQIAQELTVSKAHSRLAAVAHLGQKHQAIQTRLMVVKARILDLTPKPDYTTLADVVREVAPPELARKIFRRFSDRAAREALKGGPATKAQVSSSGDRHG